MPRSRPVPPDRATMAGAATGVMAASNDWTGVAPEEARTSETIRRELARLTALLRRHFRAGGEEDLLPALADTSNPEAAAGAHAFLRQIRTLAETLEADARRWADSAPTAGAFAEFRREAQVLLSEVSEQIAASR